MGHVEDPERETLSRRGSRRSEDEEPKEQNGVELDKRLIVHPRADGAVREAILARHEDDPFFALAAASHRHATEHAIERLAQWPSLTPLHDRNWLGSIDSRAVSPLTLSAWAKDDDELVREAVARLLDEPALLRKLALDAARRVRRAVAGNPSAPRAVVEHLLINPACEGRARASAFEARSQDSGDGRPGRGAGGVTTGAGGGDGAVRGRRACRRGSRVSFRPSRRGRRAPCRPRPG